MTSDPTKLNLRLPQALYARIETDARNRRLSMNAVIISRLEASFQEADVSDPMALKWALVDLIKVIDAAHEGRLHGDLARIAQTLGVTLTEPVIVTNGIDLSKAKKAARSVS